MLEDLKGKRLLVLGAMNSLIEVVKRAQKYGIEVFVTDYLENSPAKKYADKAFMVSTLDIDAVVELCQKEKIDGIITGFVDLLLPAYAEICKRLNFPCYGTYEHFCIMTDKRQFKDLCRKYDVPTIPEYSSDCNFDDIEYPVLVKPIDSSGSKGISVCNDKSELEKGIDKALSYSPGKHYMIEKYMTGDEIVLYYYFQDKNPVFMGMCDRYVNKEQQGVAQLPTAYVFPSKYTENHMKHTDEIIKNMYRKIGMTNGATFLQGFMDNGVPCIYEPGYRLNGARENYIYSSVNDVDSMNMLINFALTGKMSDDDIEKKASPLLHGKYACMLSSIIHKGTVARIDGLDEVRNMDSVKELILMNNVGDTISDKIVGTLAQLGYRAYVVADTPVQLKEQLDYIINTLVYYDENGNSMMLTPFDTNELLNY